VEEVHEPDPDPIVFDNAIDMFGLHSNLGETLDSKTNEDKQREIRRDINHEKGRIISLMGMLHSMLRYLEVCADLCFISITRTILRP
jgi:hypothetical protein